MQIMTHQSATKRYNLDSKESQIINWIKSFQYPHCRKTSNLSSLRTGIAIAEILSEKINEDFHYLFLSEIQIYDLSSQKCINNLSVVLNTILMCFSKNDLKMKSLMSNITAQGLYFDYKMMERFISLILMKIDQYDFDVECEKRYQNNKQLIAKNTFQQVSDIANLSSILPVENKKNNSQAKKKMQKMNQNPKLKIFQQVEQFSNKNINVTNSIQTTISKSTLQNVKLWIKEKHHLNPNQLSPEKLLGDLINSVFAGSRFDQGKQIVKRSHYSAGPMFTYRKICQYLMNIQRFPKENLMKMMKDIQEGVIKEIIYWGLIVDLWQMKKNKISKNKRKQSSNKKLKTLQSQQQQKQNIEIVTNQTEEKENCKGSKNEKTKKHHPSIYSTIQINDAQKWIENELGYQHSLRKAKQQHVVNLNPLLNGVLIGSIIMRLQIGKVIINKEPINNLQVQKNIGQVCTALIKRGYECGRKLTVYYPAYNYYMGVLFELKKQYHAKVEAMKQHQKLGLRQKRFNIPKMTHLEKEQLKLWLKQTKNIEVPNSSFLTPSKLTQICSEFLQINLYRETTQRIQESNIDKISNELQKLGFQVAKQELLNDQDNYRWLAVKSLQQLLNHKVYYY